MTILIYKIIEGKLETKEILKKTNETPKEIFKKEKEDFLKKTKATAMIGKINFVEEEIICNNNDKFFALIF